MRGPEPARAQGPGMVQGPEPARAQGQARVRVRVRVQAAGSTEPHCTNTATPSHPSRSRSG
ncbi:MAG: hypothetical protein Fur0019_09890 [Tibeticola sp.]